MLLPTLVTALALLPELTVAVANLNDDAYHFAFVRRGSEALAAGENVVDFWVPQFGMGFPEFLYYQHLPHLLVVLLDRVLFESLDLLTVFNLVRYLLLVGLPVTVFWSMRSMGFSLTASAIAAAVAPLLSTDYRYGFEYESYLWSGWGMFTQLAAMHLSFVALAALYAVVHQGRRPLVAILGLSALALSHILYAYMMAITAVVVLLVGATRANIAGRLTRLAVVGGAAGAMTSYMWLPALRSAQVFLDNSPYLERWKFDSFGAGQVLDWLVHGELFDHGRLPVLTLLLAAGIVSALVTRTRAALLLVSLFAVWLVLYFGRPTLGPVADLFPLHDSLYFHRFIGGVHLAAIPLIGIGGAALVSLVERGSPRGVLLGIATVGIVLLPAMAERWSHYDANATWMRQTKTAIDADADAREILAAIATLPPARTYPGLRSNWGGNMNFGIPFNSVRFYNLLAFDELPEVASPYSGPSVNSDLLYDFDEQRASHYDLFNAHYVVAPSAQPLPSFLTPLKRTTRYTLYSAPTTGFAEYVAVTQQRDVSSQAALFSINRAWLRSTDPDARRFIRYNYPADTDRASPADGAACPTGRTDYERVQAARLDVLVSCPTAGTLALKITYHPNWQVTVDGEPRATFMLSPSYIGVQLPAGTHFVSAEYRSSPIKAPLLVVGGTVLALAALLARPLRRMIVSGRLAP